MAEAARTEGLELLLESEVICRLGDVTLDNQARTRLRRAVRSVLRSDVLSGDEAAAAQGGELGGKALDEALGLRIHRALSDALNSLREQGVKVPDGPPSAHVLRATSAEEASISAQSLSASVSSGGLGAEDDALVLTDRTTFSALMNELVGASFRTSREQPPRSASPGIEVVEAEEELEAASRSLRVARRPSGATAEDDALVGEVLGGKYRIVSLKGRGGFGTVYEAVDAMLGAPVAVKVLNDKAARSPTALQEFLDEARRITSLDHENIVRWITFDSTPEGLHYFVMEYLSGEELDKVLKREQRLSPDRVARILLQTLAALREAHHRPDGESLLHLDLKPQNLFIQPGNPERVKVIDFGIGQHVGAEAISAAQEATGGRGTATVDLEASLATVRSSVSADHKPSSAPGVKRARGGTLLYSSPEQCAHLAGAPDIVALDGRSDLYSLGVMAFKMLTGHYPWKDWSSLNQGFKNHVEIPPCKVTDFGVKVPRRLVAFIERCLEKDRDARWKDTQEAYEAMEAIVHPPTWPRLVAVLVPLLFLAVGASWWFRPEATGGAIELRVAAGNTTRSASSQPIYLGEQRPFVDLQVGKLAGALRGEPARLLRYEDGAGVDAVGVPVEGVDLAWASDGLLRLDAPDLSATGLPATGSEVSVRVEGSDGAQESSRFRLVVMPPGAWQVTELDVVDAAGVRGTRAVVPAGLDLEIVASARLADLDRVEVHHPGARSPLVVAAGAGRETDGAVIYTVSLDALDLPEGPVTLEARVSDRSGGVQTRRTELEVVSGALRLEEEPVLESCRELDGKWIITPKSEPVLRVALLRPATMSWQLRGGGQIVAEDKLPASLAHELAIPRERFAEARNGTLRLVFDEDALVMHAGGASKPGVLESKLSFTYIDRQPEFSVSLDGRLLSGDRFVTRDQLQFEVTPRGERVPTQLDVTLVRQADAAVMQVPSTRLELDQQSARLPVELPADGAYRLSVHGAPYDPASGELLGAPTTAGPYRLVLDRQAPELSWADPGDILLRDGAEGAELTLDVRGEASGDGADAMTVRYRLAASGVDPGDATGAAEVAWSSAQAQAVDGVWKVSLPDARTLGADGHYRLDLHVLDSAGNRSGDVSRSVTIATQGPQLTLSKPGRFDEIYGWEPDAVSGRWLVTVRARDPNGTAGVSAQLSSEDDASMRVDIPLEPSDTGAEQSVAVESQWSGGIALDHTWSGATVLLTLSAEDELGVASSPLEVRLRLPTIQRDRPRAVAVTLPGRPTVPMRLLSARGRADYVFHGRLDETENEDYRRWGLPLFNSKDLPIAWKLRLPAELLPDLYLDERETTEADYLAFLHAPDGWVDASHWPATPGSAERAAELEARLAASVDATPELPVTAVSWDEAAAFAHWMGKRLPTLVEWEVAVRGTEPGDYRPYASHGAHSGLPDPSVVNYAPDGDGSSTGPWPATLGEDVCARTGLRNLCSNVAEWTASPASFTAPGERAPLNQALHFADHLDELVDPGAWSGWAAAAEYWVVGGSFRLPSVDFSATLTQRRQKLRPDVGFRCALEVPQVFAVMEGSMAGRVERLDP